MAVDWEYLAELVERIRTCTSIYDLRDLYDESWDADALPLEVDAEGTTVEYLALARKAALEAGH